MASKCDEEKNSFTNQVVKDKIVFPLFFWSNLMAFEFKRFDFPVSFFFFAKKSGYKKVDVTDQSSQRLIMYIFLYVPHVIQAINLTL